MMAELKVKFDDRQMGELVARVIEHFAIDNGNITEIVRCKDCKFGVYEKGRGIYHTRCEILEFLFQDDDYCSYGERREE